MSEGGIGWVAMLARPARQHHGALGLRRGLADKQLAVRGAAAQLLVLHDRRPLDDLTRDAIGVENIMLESDYPHGDGTWPDTQPVMEKMLGGLPVEGSARSRMRTRRSCTGIRCRRFASRNKRRLDRGTRGGRAAGAGGTRGLAGGPSWQVSPVHRDELALRGGACMEFRAGLRLIRAPPAPPARRAFAGASRSLRFRVREFGEGADRRGVDPRLRTHSVRGCGGRLVVFASVVGLGARRRRA